MFDTILNFYTNNIISKKHAKYINQTNFNKIPKRCRNALKKQENNGYLIYTNKENADKISLCFMDGKARQQFTELSNEARNLIPLIYIKTKKTISDEQINAFNRLQKIFGILTNLCFFVKIKSNANNTMLEYNHSKNNKDIVLKARENESEIIREIENRIKELEKEQLENTDKNLFNEENSQENKETQPEEIRR